MSRKKTAKPHPKEYAWAKPGPSTQFHVFTEGNFSLCGRWELMDIELTPIDLAEDLVAGKNDCKACFDHLKKIHAFARSR